MRCPKCGTTIDPAKGRYDYAKGCPVCGWTRRSTDGRPGRESEYVVSFGQWIVCLVFAILFVFGPLVVVRQFFPALWNPTFVTRHYWIGWLIYLALSWLLSPRPDIENLGYFGGLVQGPFNYEHSINRFLLLLGLALVPGKITLAAVLGLPRHLRSLLRRP